MTLESALIPIPSEVTMAFSGFLVSKGMLQLFPVILAGAIGNLVGSWIAYAIGFYLEETIILSLVGKYGKFILMTKEDYKKTVDWFHKYGNSVVFFSRLLPAVRTFISLPAGLAKMNIWKFSIYTFVGSFLWTGVLAYFGVYLGNNWKTLDVYYKKFEFLIVGLLIFAVIFYINHKLKFIKLKAK